MADPKKAELEETSIDMTPMIDVVFLLIIFFLLLPPKVMEGQLQAYLPEEGSSNEKADEPPTVFNIVLKQKAGSGGDTDLITLVTLNNEILGEFTTFSIEKLNGIYDLPRAQQASIFSDEYKRDEEQFDPEGSPVLVMLLEKLTSAARFAEKEQNTDVLIDANPNVPFKVVLGILNAVAPVFKNTKFVAPPPTIFSAK